METVIATGIEQIAAEAIIRDLARKMERLSATLLERGKYSLTFMDAEGEKWFLFYEQESRTIKQRPLSWE